MSLCVLNTCHSIDLGKKWWRVIERKLGCSCTEIQGEMGNQARVLSKETLPGTLIYNPDQWKLQANNQNRSTKKHIFQK